MKRKDTDQHALILNTSRGIEDKQIMIGIVNNFNFNKIEDTEINI